MIPDIDHIAIVVSNIEDKLPIYTEILKMRLKSVEDVPHMFVRVAMLESPNGTTHIELVEPTGENSGVARFLQKKGEVVHHLCFLVDNIQQELDRLKKEGVRLIDETPKAGQGRSKVAFLHPESCGGMLIELKQKLPEE